MISKYFLCEILADEAKHEIDAFSKCLERVSSQFILISWDGIRDKMLHFWDGAVVDLVIGL